MFDDGLPHSYTHVVVKVHHVMHRFRLSPLAQVVRLLTLDSSNTEPVKSGRCDASILSVVVLYPVIKLLQYRKVVNMISWWGAVRLEPDELGGVKYGGNY